MITFVDLVGYAGALTGVTFMLPQLWRSWRTGSVDDLSWWMLLLYFANTVLWFVYGALLWSVPLMMTNVLAAFVAIAQLRLKARFEDLDFRRVENRRWAKGMPPSRPRTGLLPPRDTTDGP